MPSYQLDMPLQFEATLDKLAKKHNTTYSEILRRALATYATLQNYDEVYVKLPAKNGSTPPQSTGLRRIAIP